MLKLKTNVYADKSNVKCREAVVWRCSVKKLYLKNFAKFARKDLYGVSLLKKLYFVGLELY